MNARKILIFMGAGASVPLGLPASTGFIQGVNTASEPITKYVINYLGEDSGKDIEWILSTLESFKTEVAFTEHLIPHFLEESPYANNVQPHIKQRVRNLKSSAASEVKRIKKIIFEKLSNFDHSQAETLYKNLLQEIFETHPDSSLTLITTNYDLTFETAIERLEGNFSTWGLEHIDYGFSERFGRPIYDSSRDNRWEPNTIQYLKIHGSLDWHRDSQGRCSRSGSSTTPDNPDQMAILYPGFKEGLNNLL